MADTVTIQEAMAKVMGDVREVAKTDRNNQQNFTFRGVDAVVNAVAPALRKYGVVVLPFVKTVDYAPYTTGRGTQMMCCRVVAEYRFVGPGGDSLIAQVAGEASDAGDKSTPKAMSVAFRTALLQALALPTDDKDPDQDLNERGESTAAVRPVTRPTERSGAQAAQAAASPQSSTEASGVAVDREAPAGDGDDRGSGEGAAEPTPAGASTNVLSREDQALLETQFGSKLNAIKAYKAMFGQHITRMSDITYEMRDSWEEANGAVGAQGEGGPTSG